jgi:hypothetical protein
MFKPNLVFMLVQKLKSTPRALHKDSRLKKEKNSICPKLLINAKVYVLAQRLIKGYHQTWEPNL